MIRKLGVMFFAILALGLSSQAFSCTGCGDKASKKIESCSGDKCNCKCNKTKCASGCKGAK